MKYKQVKTQVQTWPYKIKSDSLLGQYKIFNDLPKITILHLKLTVCLLYSDFYYSVEKIIGIMLVGFRPCQPLLRYFIPKPV